MISDRSTTTWFDRSKYSKLFKAGRGRCLILKQKDNDKYPYLIKFETYVHNQDLMDPKNKSRWIEKLKTAIEDVL